VKLPEEIKQKIFAFAVALEEPIRPSQVKNRSNKFFWSESQRQVKEKGKEKDKVSSTLTVVQLSKVSRQIYEEVIRTYIFYTVNQFEFRDLNGLITYLIAITPFRLKAIRSIKCQFPRFYWGRDRNAVAFNVLTACEDLQNLEFSFDVGEFYLSYNDATSLSGYKQLLTAVRGLKTLKLTVSEPHLVNTFHYSQYKEGSKTFRDALEPILRQEMKHPRLPHSKTLFVKAQKIADLDIDGDGRLGEDRKPGVVASRTRQQLRNQDKLDSDGTIPRRVSAKYDLNGDLAWYIESITASRESKSDDGVYGVEFLVKTERTYGGRDRYWYNHSVPKEQSWEDVSVLNSTSARSEIASFYQKNSKAYGMQTVLDIWKLGVENDEEKHKKEMITKHLETIVHKEAIRKQHEAEMAAQAKQAAKAKAKGKIQGKSKVSKHTSLIQ
jgi:hypothetical protein